MSLISRIVFSALMKTRTDYDPAQPKDYAALRENELKQTAALRIPKAVRITQETLHDVPVEWVTSVNNAHQQIIYYIHGGGFVTGSPEARRSFTTYIADKMGYNVAAVDYRLAPEHPFPAGLEDCIAVYQGLLETHSARDIAIVGESAGGNLVLAVLLALKERGIELPVCAQVIAPTVQYDRELPSYTKNCSSDCIVTNLSDEVCDVYVGSHEPDVLKNPLLAPLYGDYRNCPPIDIWASTTEVLADDSKLLYRKLKKDGVETTIFMRKNMMHTYIIVPFFPESKKDLKRMQQKLQKRFKAGACTGF
ncbi:MAG: alpha/beta hydrolase fold domain-containing protein [Eubacteriales bacterium]|nr:alpha/beta hydrolase fold domain-containing protein [Eubacteriales bacterium]